MLATFTPETTTAQWIGYQIITTIGRGMAFQVVGSPTQSALDNPSLTLSRQQPVVSIQDLVPASETATALAIVNLFMNLGAAVATSVSQTIFQTYLPGLLAEHVPGIDPQSVLEAGATNVRSLVSSESGELEGLLVAYNEALVRMFVSSMNPFAILLILALNL